MNAERRNGLHPIDIPRILEKVPNYTEFMTGAELFAGSRRLVKDHWNMVQEGKLSWEIIGESTEGRKIDLLRVGNGKKKVMWVGTPHPNEPIGTLAIDFMSRYLCYNPEVLEAIDATFLFVKNADPDGLELNVSWLKGTIDPVKYALGFYRPSHSEQVEWGFPIDYETLHFHNSPKETEAIMQAFNTHRPDMVYSLHNAALTNPYYQLTPKIDRLVNPLQRIFTDEGMSLGNVEDSYVEKWAEGIFEYQTVKIRYDEYKKLPGDPKDRIQGGASMSEYLARINPDAISLITEIPFFTSAALKDHTPSTMTRKSAILEGANARQKIVDYMEEQYKSLGVIPDGRLKRAVKGNLKTIRSHIKSSVTDLDKAEYADMATGAEVYREIHCNRYYQVLQLGQVYRLALEASDRAKERGWIKISENAGAQAEEIKAYIENVINEINKVSPIETIPLQKLVGAQVAAGLTAMQHDSLRFL